MRLSVLSPYLLQTPLTVFQDPAVSWFFPYFVFFPPASFLSEGAPKIQSSQGHPHPLGVCAADSYCYG